MGLGILLTSPFLFAYWDYVSDGTGVEDWFWTGFTLLTLACLGFGMMFGGTIAYLGKYYNVT